MPPIQSGQFSTATSKNHSVVNTIKQILKTLPRCKGARVGSNYGTSPVKNVMDGWKERQQGFHVFKYQKSLSNFL